MSAKSVLRRYRGFGRAVPNGGSCENEYSGQMRRFNPFFQLLKVRLLEFVREPEVVFWVFGFPLVLAFVLGIAFREKPTDNVRVAFIVNTKSESNFEKLKSSSITITQCDRHKAENGFRFGEYDIVVEWQDETHVRFTYDPSRPESEIAFLKVNQALQVAAGRQDSIVSSTVVVTEPGSRYIDFLIPGLLGMNLMNSGLFGVGFGIVGMREKKLLKRLAATPMRRSDFLLALAVSRILVMIIEMTVLLVFGVWVFAMPLSGSVPSTILICLLGALCFSTLGLLIASRTGKTETANGLTNLMVVPMTILSGVFFSYERLPATLVPVIRLLPLTALNDALRSVVLQGAPLFSQWRPGLILTCWTVLSFSAAMHRFNWTS